MAGNNDIPLDKSDFDAQLHDAEGEFAAAISRLAPALSPEPGFTHRLETQLRALAAPAHSAYSRASSITPGPTLPARRSERLPLRRQAAIGGRLLHMGVGAAVLAIVVLGLAGLWLGAQRSRVTTSQLPVTSVPRDSALQNFIPDGKVRHLTVQWSSSEPISYSAPAGVVNSPVHTYMQDVWLTNGGDHPLMYTAPTDPPAFEKEGANFFTLGALGQVAWVDNSYIYRYTPLESPKVLRVSAFEWRYLNLYLPAPASGDEYKPMFSPDSYYVTGNGTVNGRSVVLAKDSLLTVPTPAPVSQYAATTNLINRTDIALDSQTGQVVHFNRATYYISGTHSGSITTLSYDLLGDELQDRSDYPPDFFTFKMPPGIQHILTNPGIDWPTPSPATTQSP